MFASLAARSSKCVDISLRSTIGGVSSVANKVLSRPVSSKKHCATIMEKVPFRLHHVSSSKIMKPVVVVYSQRQLSLCNSLNQEENKGPVEVEETGESEPAAEENGESVAPGAREPAKKVPENLSRHMNKDRTKVIPVETSIRYLRSSAYKETYGSDPVWVPYRRNFPGQFQPIKTRKKCIRNGVLSTGNPCPICRDEYLVVHHLNVDLLKQFISPYNGEILGFLKTGVCLRQQRNLTIEIDRAKEYGLITFDVPFREYDYKEYEAIYASY